LGNKKIQRNDENFVDVHLWSSIVCHYVVMTCLGPLKFYFHRLRKFLRNVWVIRS